MELMVAEAGEKGSSTGGFYFLPGNWCCKVLGNTSGKPFNGMGKGSERTGIMGLVGIFLAFFAEGGLFLILGVGALVACLVGLAVADVGG